MQPHPRGFDAVDTKDTRPERRCPTRSVPPPKRVERYGDTILFSGNRAVVICQQDSHVWANLYVNAQNGIEHADITLTRWQGKTMKGAERFAAKVLAR